jgi:hypothetical protein
MFVGRTEEIGVLRTCFEAEGSSFVAVYGRRRVGKTHLVKTLFGDVFGFYCTGLANTGAKGQLASFGDALHQYGEPRQAPPRDWFAAFRRLRDLLAGRDRDRKAVVFLDELPWLDAPKAGLIPALEWFWNSWASTGNVLLIACGSASSWMNNKVLHARGGLHNRVSHIINLQPFTLAESQEFLSAKGVVMSQKDILEAYMVFGGIPFYLDLLDGRFSLAQNVGRLCFSAAGRLKNEFDDLYASLFRRPEPYVSVVTALGAKKKGLTRDDVARVAGLQASGRLTSVLRDLVSSGFVRAHRPFSRKSRGTLYQLVDFYTLFYLSFVADGPDDSDYWVKFSGTGGHAAWSGYAFEGVCLQHARQIMAKLGILGVIAKTSAWRSERVRPGAQIDLVIDRADNVINLCEMKYASDVLALTRADEEALRRKRSAFVAETGTRKAIHLTMVTTYGLAPGKYRGSVQSEVTADDLFQP